MAGDGPLARHLRGEHERLEAHLRAALDDAGRLDRAAFDAFRAGLLRHIAVEEKLLLPALREARRGEHHPLAARLRVDHAALTSLLVGTPAPELVGEIRSILGPHDELEEAPGGLYDDADATVADPAGLVERMRAYPPVRLMPYRDGPRVMRRAADALSAASRATLPRRSETP